MPNALPLCPHQWHPHIWQPARSSTTLLNRNVGGVFLGNLLGYTRASETASAPCCILQGIHLIARHHGNLLENELRDSIRLLHFEWFWTVVEKDDANLTTVISIDDPCPNVDHTLRCES